MKRLSFLYLIGLFALLPLQAKAATFFVNAATGNNANTCLTAGDPCLTIQAALDLAELTPEDDTVNVAAGTYNTGGGGDSIVEIDSNVSIVGANTQTTIIDGSGTDRVVRVNSTTPGGTTASISNVTIQNGNDTGSGAEGSGVRNNGNLTLDSVAIQNNDTSDGDGGGVFNGRAPGNPPALLLIMNSTISDNLANGKGGGISNGGEGEGDPDHAGTLIMVNSTVSGNASGANPDGESAGGGIYNHSTSTATLFNVTVANNTANNTSGLGGPLNGGGGVYNNGGTFSINNSLIANNADGSSVDANDCFGTLGSTEGFNLVEDLNGCTLSGSTAGNVTGVDPGIGSLSNNGGPTLTHALLSGSEAIDAGDPSGCVNNTGANMTQDQRGSTRPLAGIEGNSAICDIGAFEAAAGTTPAPDGGGCSVGQGSGNALSFAALLGLSSALWLARRRRSLVN